MTNNIQFDESLNQMKGQLEIIKNQLIHISYIDDLFWQIQAIIKENLELHNYNIFYIWITDTYIDSMAIGVRRLIDRKKGTISLWRLLNDMKNSAKYFSREWYLTMFDESFKSFGNNNFSDLIETGCNKVTKKRINSKQLFLKESVSIIEEFANTKIAHFSKNQNGAVFKLRNLREAIASIFYIFNWCSLLLTAKPLHTPVPLNTGMWLEVFNIPWLEEGKPIPEYRHLDEIINELNEQFKVIDKEIENRK